MTLEIVSQAKSFGGTQFVYKHQSEANSCEMKFSAFVPAQASQGPTPVLYFLSGLTCTEENFTVKACAQRAAALHGITVIAPDTSPRGEGVANDDAYDLGQGAGFYVNATEAPWAEHFHMYDYVVEELTAIVSTIFSIDPACAGITGHSMGGHGALTIGLRNPDKFCSISAFAPIVAPVQVPWGEKALTSYLGEDKSKWQVHDATNLIESGARSANTILIDQGGDDSFLQNQLKPELFANACRSAGQPLELRMQEGYDHSYFFIASFIDDHVAHHAKAAKEG
ncbi:S-formylglutathione hydrolase [Alphaproteobacteria bacterium]|jgi:S-formylglutathione hydrolase|nr:S-formylglutathione hydrolase [Alphaproteobacteria bacterium]